MYEGKDKKPQIFHYHGYGHGCGGYVERHGNIIPIPSVGGAALSMAGGEAYTETGPFSWAPPFEPDPPVGFRLSVQRITTHLWTEESDKEWVTNADVTVYGFNLCERVKIGIMRSRLTSRHPKGIDRTVLPNGGQPRISFDGSYFVNVTIDNQPVVITLDTDLDTCPTHQQLREVVSGQRPTTHCPRNLCTGANDPQYMQELATHYQSKQFTRCSIVGHVGHPTAHGYSVDLTDPAKPDEPAQNLGRVFFGEMVVGDEMKRLNMIRWNLGCEACGDGTGGGADLNGTPMP
jgi:hypothetical protein